MVFFLASTRSRRPLVSGAVDHSKWSRQIVSMAATNSKQTDNGSNDRRRTISPSLSLRSSILRWSRAVSCCEFVSRPTVAVGKGPQHYSSPSSSAVARAESGSRTRLSVPRTFHSVAVRIVTIALLHISFACGPGAGTGGRDKIRVAETLIHEITCKWFRRILFTFFFFVAVCLRVCFAR